MSPVIPLPERASRFIPHEGQMMFLDSLLAADKESGTADVRIRDGHVLMNESGKIDPVVYPELVAQTYAAVRGHELLQAGMPLQPGYLVGVQKCEVLDLASNEDLVTISVQTVGKFSGFAVVEGTVQSEKRTLATAKIKLYIPSESGEDDHA